MYRLTFGRTVHEPSDIWTDHGLYSFILAWFGRLHGLLGPSEALEIAQGRPAI